MMSPGKSAGKSLNCWGSDDYYNAWGWEEYPEPYANYNGYDANNYIGNVTVMLEVGRETERQMTSTNNTTTRHTTETNWLNRQAKRYQKDMVSEIHYSTQ